MKEREPKQVRLEFCEGSSDKVYVISLQKDVDSNGWLVVCRYGRWNNVHNHALKTPEPISYGQADEIYRKTLNQKLRKGYQIAG